MAEREASGAKAMLGVRALSSVTKGISFTVARQLVLAVVFPRLDYLSSLLWASPLRTQCITAFDRIQRTAARLVSGGLASTSLRALEVSAYLLPTSLRLERSAFRTAVRHRTLPRRHPLSQLLRKPSPSASSIQRKLLSPALALQSAFPALVPLRIEIIDPCATVEPSKTHLDLPEHSIPPTKELAVLAHDAVLAHADDSAIVLYSDGSLLDERAGAGLAWRKRREEGEAGEGEWAFPAKGRALGQHQTVYVSELVGVNLGITTIHAMLDARPPAPVTAHLFLDNQSAVSNSFSPLASSGQQLRRRNRTAYLNLVRAHPHLRLMVHWVPGHVGVDGNEAADEAAKDAAGAAVDGEEGGQYVEQVDMATGAELPKSAAALLAAFDLALPARWDALWRSDARGGALRRLDLHAPSRHILRLHQHLPRPLSSLLTQLRTSHSHLLADRFRSRLCDSDRCECGAPETLHHFLLACPLYRIARRDLAAAVGPHFRNLPLLLTAPEAVPHTLVPSRTSTSDAAPASASSPATAPAALPVPSLQDAVNLIDNSRAAVRDCLAGLDLDAHLKLNPSRGSGTMLKACSACRAMKIRCKPNAIDTGPGQPCERCQSKSIPCEFLEKRKLGRKVTNRRTLKLLAVQRNLDRLESLLQRLSASSISDLGVTPPACLRRAAHIDPAPGSSAESLSDSDSDSDIWNVLASPLELMTLSSEKPSAPPHSASNAADRPHDFDHVLDADLTLDPVSCGLVKDHEFERFITLRVLRIFSRRSGLLTLLPIYGSFFTNMQGSTSYLIDPALYTPLFIRRTSPFLATMLALVAAIYDPLAGDIVPHLEQHARQLSSRVFLHGFKSMEVVLAYMLWVFWSAAEENSAHDRNWLHLGCAVRICSEIRLDKPLPPRVLDQYRRLLHPFPVSYKLLERMRQQTFHMVFCLEITTASQTGRLQSMLNIPGPYGSNDDPVDTPEYPPVRTPQGSLQPDPRSLFNNNLALCHCFAKAMRLYAGLREKSLANAEGLRDAFNSAWRTDFEQWEQRWNREVGNFREVPYLARLNRHIILLSFSLYFDGPARPVLEECRQVAIRAAQYICEWKASRPSILYACNSIIIHIAYSTNILLRFSTTPSEDGRFAVDPFTYDLCDKVIEVLSTISATRLHGLSLATIYAKKLRVRLNQLSPLPVASLPPLQLNFQRHFTTPAPPAHHPFVPPLGIDPSAANDTAAAAAGANYPSDNLFSFASSLPASSAPTFACPSHDFDLNVVRPAPLQPAPEWCAAGPNHAPQPSWEQLFSWLPPGADEWGRTAQDVDLSFLGWPGVGEGGGSAF
ncbi:hypothetical protein JCM10207_007303 [Rhodosporidiobolus poonsookiae]